MNTAPRLFIVTPDCGDFESVCNVFAFDRVRTFQSLDTEQAEWAVAYNRELGIEAVAVVLHAKNVKGFTVAPLAVATPESEADHAIP